MEVSGKSDRVEESKSKRSQVLSRYEDVKQRVQQQRVKLEQAKLLHLFRRDAEVLETWINEKVQIASDEAYKDRRNLQVHITYFGIVWVWLSLIL